MRITILGLNYAPEPVGIGPYTAGTAEFLAADGHQVSVICAKPYYPEWRVQSSYRGSRSLESTEHGVAVCRVPIYVPARPSGIRRLLHHFSFSIRVLPALVKAARSKKPDLVICIAPSLISAVTARIFAKLCNAKYWLHVQDFEVEAAFATGLLKSGGIIANAARAFEKWCLRRAMVSTISPQMCAKLSQLGVPDSSIYEFRNWANIEKIKPLEGVSAYRSQWNITTPYVALYSGNLGNKQGIEIIPDVARLLSDRDDLTFVICGNGASRDRLISAAAGLTNIQFHDLQPAEMMSDLLGLATVHLLPQIEGAADLVLPSKLANMLASGIAVLATAAPGTGLAREVEGCGEVVPPENAALMAGALELLLRDDAKRNAYGVAGRARAEAAWAREPILRKFAQKLREVVHE